MIDENNYYWINLNEENKYMAEQEKAKIDNSIY